MRIPVFLASATMASCIAVLSPPSSANPDEMITAFLTPAAAHCSSAPSTARAGMMTMARSIGALIAEIDG